VQRKVVKRANKRLAVDLHCHVQTPAADEIAKQSTAPKRDAVEQHGSQRTADRQKALRAELDKKLTSVEQRLADMDRMGIDVQAISTSPSQYYYRIEPDLARQTCRVINENLAGMVQDNPDRFVALGTVPMQEPALAVEELEYCMAELGFRGLEIGTNVRKVELSDERYEKFWQKAEALGAVVFLHPSGFTDTSRLNEHFLTNVIGNPSIPRSRSRISFSAACSSAIRSSRSLRRTAADISDTIQREWTTHIACDRSVTTASSGRQPIT
jgi:aminocarboxymuconate-semialdehyde decarboxylase